MVVYDPDYLKKTRRWGWIRRRFCWLLSHERTYNDVTPWVCRWCAVCMGPPEFHPVEPEDPSIWKRGVGPKHPLP